MPKDENVDCRSLRSEERVECRSLWMDDFADSVSDFKELRAALQASLSMPSLQALESAECAELRADSRTDLADERFDARMALAELC